MPALMASYVSGVATAGSSGASGGKLMFFRKGEKLREKVRRKEFVVFFPGLCVLYLYIDNMFYIHSFLLLWFSQWQIEICEKLAEIC